MYDPSKVDWTGEEHELAAHAVAVVEAVRAELHDEDPGEIDFDDIITILPKVAGHVMALVRAFLGVEGASSAALKAVSLGTMVQRHEELLEAILKGRPAAHIPGWALPEPAPVAVPLAGEPPSESGTPPTPLEPEEVSPEATEGPPQAPPEAPNTVEGDLPPKSTAEPRWGGGRK